MENNLSVLQRYLTCFITKTLHSIQNQLKILNQFIQEIKEQWSWNELECITAKARQSQILVCIICGAAVEN